MTIQLLQYYNGQAPGVYTLAGAEETRLIGLGLARAYTPGMDGQNPVFSAAEQVATRALVSGAGITPPRLLGSADMIRARRLSPQRNVVLPTPYGSVGAAVVHPSVEYTPDSWGGYLYWLAATPYPANNSAYENPIMLASNDRVNWVSPPGVRVPLIDKPGTLGENRYNSDTHLLRDPTNPARMILLYRRRDSVANQNIVFVITSTDGWKTFTEPVAIWTVTISAANDLASPSLYYDDVAAKWVVIGHNADGAQPMQVRKITSSDLFTGWDTSATALTFPAAANRAWWHSHIRRQSDGTLVGIAQDNAQTVGASGNLYMVFSTDGLTFTSAPLDMGGNWYRPTFAIVTGADLQPRMECYFNKLLNTTTQLVGVSFDADQFTALRGYPNQLLSLSTNSLTAPGTLWADTFTRADSAVSPGTATSGGAYTVDSGTMGISTNRLYGVTTGSNNRMLSAALGNADHSAQITIDTVGAQAWFIFRAVDATNYWRLGFNTATTYRVQSIVAGAVGTTDQVVGPAPAAGDRLRAVCAGTLIRLFINDAFVFEIDTTVHQAGARVGAQSTGASLTYFDNLAAWAT